VKGEKSKAMLSLLTFDFSLSPNVIQYKCATQQGHHFCNDAGYTKNFFLWNVANLQQNKG